MIFVLHRSSWHLSWRVLVTPLVTAMTSVITCSHSDHCCHGVCCYCRGVCCYSRDVRCYCRDFCCYCRNVCCYCHDGFSLMFQWTVLSRSGQYGANVCAQTRQNHASEATIRSKRATDCRAMDPVSRRHNVLLLRRRPVTCVLWTAEKSK